jgi:hypothetical protein
MHRLRDRTTRTMRVSEATNRTSLCTTTLLRTRRYANVQAARSLYRFQLTRSQSKALYNRSMILIMT